MAMIRTYQGFFQEDGRFITDGVLVKLPTKRRAIVNILDDEAAEAHGITRLEANRKPRASVIKDILADALAAEDSILTDADWVEMTNLRSRTNVGLSRAAEL